MEEVKCIDLFSLRVLALIVCRGKPNDKTSFLAAMVNLGYDEVINKNDERMTKALRLILYFSSILPNKFLSEKKDDEIFFEILGFSSKSYKDKRRNKVLNKKARHNLCFADEAQKADFEKGLGTIVPFSILPID